MCSSIAACILIAVNIGVLLVGLGISIIGALLTWGQDILTKYLSSALSVLTKTTSVAGPNDVSLTLENISSLLGDYVKYLSSAGLVIFIFGAVLLGIGICGVCGACCKSKILLVVYCICVGVILVAMIVLTCLIGFKKDDVRKEGQTFLKKYIKDTFVGLNAGGNAESAILSLVMARLSCCGVTNSSDFNDAQRWNRTYAFPGNGTTVTLKIPLSCCKMKTGSYEPQDFGCITAPNSTNSNMEKGCYAQLWALVDSVARRLMHMLIASSVILFILLVCAAAVIRAVKKKDAGFHREQRHEVEMWDY